MNTPPLGAGSMNEDNNMRRLEGKTAIVTGAANGIGAACARRLSREGATVVVADLDRAGAERVAGEINAAGGAAWARHFDLGDEASIVALIAATKARFGKLEILHNNAADNSAPQIRADVAVADLATAIFDQAMKANARGTMVAIREALPLLMTAGESAIINTSSGAAQFGDIARASYGASKAAIDALTKYVATQYGKYGVRCNAVAPGLIQSRPAEQSKHSPEILAMFRRHTPLPYLGTPDDIAGMVSLLASADGRYITGQVISIDGGISAHFPFCADLEDLMRKGDLPGGSAR
jgi:NAD(P)-dependent dehydrogenase (short-subunit alcohol dehydrogenase family)